MLASFVFSSLVTAFFYRGVRFKAAMVEWTPSESCEGFPPGFSVPDYMPFIQKVAFLDGIQVMKVFEFIDGSLKIIPTMVFPILTFLLVQNLRSANKLRRKASTSKGGEENSKTDQTTKLVILIAITYITAEGPWAVVTMIRSLDSGPSILLSVLNILNVLVAMNTITHFFICLAISSQYQKAVKDVFSCGKEKLRSNSTNISVTAARSSRSI
ncbi:unnamed protein product [Caenorhabditis brenneri]